MSSHKPPSDILVQSRASSSYDPYSSTILDLDTDDEKIIRRHALKQYYGSSEGTAASSSLTEKKGKKGDKNLDSDRPPSPMTTASSIALEPERRPSPSNKKPMSKPLPKPVLFIQDELQRRRHLSPKSRLVGFGCCCCCVVAILLAVIGIPVFYLVCLPRMVQSTIQSSQVHWDQILFEPPPSLSSNIMTSKRAESSIFSMKFEGKVEKAGFFPAVIEFPDPITVYWQNTELGQLTGLKVLEVTIGGRGTIQEDRTQLEIWDRDLFSGFAKGLTAASGTAQDVDWSISTQATVWIMGFIRIPNVKLHKDVPIPGMNGLQNIKVASFDLPGDIPSNSTGNGALMAMSLFLNNPSPFGLALGAVTFDLMFQGTLIGQAITISTETNTAILYGGGISSSSPLMLEGSLYRQTNQTDLDNLSTLMSNYLSGKISNITARPVTRGSTDLSGGVTPDSWFYDAIMALTLNIPLQSPTTQNVLRDVQITDLGFAFSQASAFVPTIQSKSMSGAFKLPFNISTQMQSVRNTMALATSQGTLLGNLQELTPSVASSRAPGVIAFSLAPSKLTIVNEDAKADFEAFLADLTSKAEVPFSITGLSNATMNTALGPLTLSNLPFNSAVSIKAFGLNSPGQMSDAVVLSNAVVSGGTEDHLIITGTASFMNPSALSVITDAGIMLMVLDRNTNQVLGELSVGSLNIVPGLNAIPTQFLFHPMDPNVRDMFLVQSLAGGSTGLGGYSTTSIPIRIIGPGSPFAPFAMGPPLAGSNPELEKALSQVALSGSIAGLKPSTLITSGQLTSTIGGAGSGLLTTLSIQFHNPFGTELAITSLSIQIIWRGNLFGAVSDSASTNSVPANGIASSSASMAVQHPPGLDGLFMNGQFDTANPGVALGASAGALVAFDLDNVIQLRIGGPVGYAATVKYRQTVNLMTKVNVPSPSAPAAPPPPPPPATVAPPPPATVAPPAQKPTPTSVLSYAPVPAPAPIAGTAAVPVTDKTGSHPSTPPTSAPSPGSH